jgi:hypothetical protein
VLGTEARPERSVARARNDTHDPLATNWHPGRDWRALRPGPLTRMPGPAWAFPSGPLPLSHGSSKVIYMTSTCLTLSAADSEWAAARARDSASRPGPYAA